VSPGPRSKWERLLELEARPRAIEEQLLDEAAKLLAGELRGAFPPEVGGFESPADAARFAPLFEPSARRPDPGVYRVAFHLARLELRREVEEIDRYMRARDYLPLAPGAHDKLALLLLSRWLTEQALALKAQLHTPLSRARLCALLDRAELRLLGPRH